MVVDDPEATGGERAKILDFGLAKLIEPEASGAGLTNTGTILGTPAYMAPEQCKSARAADDRSDVYSLGIILYEMLTGDIPFDAETDAELLSMHMFQEPPALAKRAPHVNPRLAQLVHRMLRKEPGSRPSAGDVAAELTQLLTAGGDSASSLPPPPRTREAVGERVTLVSRPEPGVGLRPNERGLPASGRTARRGRSGLQVLLWAVAGILLFCCLGLLGLLWYRQQQGEQPAAVVRWLVSSVPSEAELLDESGRSLGRTPLTLERPRGEGEVTLVLHHDGYLDQRLTFSRELDSVRTERLVALPRGSAGAAGNPGVEEPAPAALLPDLRTQMPDGMEPGDQRTGGTGD